MEKIKMRSIVFITIILGSSILGTYAFVLPSLANEVDTLTVIADDENETNDSYGTVTVPGRSKQECEPDIMSIIIEIIGEDYSSAVVARDEAAFIIDQVLKSLEDIGILKENIETSSYTIESKYEWENSRRVFKGYEAIVIMKITLKDFDNSGQVIDACVEADAFIDEIIFELSNEKINEMKTIVMADAAVDAKIKAEAVVKTLGYELGNVKSVNIEDYSYKPYTYKPYFSGDNVYYPVSSPSQTAILPGDLTISACVNVVFEII
jgi:hypothetical protein